MIADPPLAQPEQVVDPTGQPCDYRNEVTLFALLLVLLKRKMLIIGTVGIAAVVAVVASLLLPNIYRSSATIIPYTDSTTTQRAGGLPSALGGLTGLTGGGILSLGPDTDLTQLEVFLKSRELTHQVISKYELLPILFTDDWDPDGKAWTTDKPPTDQDAFRVISREFLSVVVDPKRGTINVAFDHRDRQFARDMVHRYLTELSEALREASVHDSREKAAFVQEELNRTADALLREKLYSLLANEIAKETFARAQKYYGFRVIDPPIVPDPDKRVKPRRTFICILSVIAGFFLAVFAVFFLEFIRKAKEAATPEQRENLRKHLTFFKWRQNTS